MTRLTATATAVILAVMFVSAALAQTPLILYREASETAETFDTQQNEIFEAPLPVPVVSISSATETELDFLWNKTAPATESTFIAADPFSTSLSVLSSLFLIIMLAFGLSWFLQKKGLVGRNTYGKTLGILPLDSKRLIYITEIMGKVYVLGVTEHNINLIDEISDTEIIKLLKLQNKPAEKNFDKLFADIAPHIGNDANKKETKDQASHVENLKNLMTKLK
jgi:flagellar protein FliO/FliZ